jgi:hypothetical protein
MKLSFCNSVELSDGRISFGMLPQTFNLIVVSNQNGTILTSALNYWQNLAPNSGGLAVGLIVEVRPGVYHKPDIALESLS